MLKDLDQIILISSVNDKQSFYDYSPITSKHDLIDLFLSDYSISYKNYTNNKKLYRGSNTNFKYPVLAKPSGKTRTPAMKTFLFMSLFSDILDSWKNFPKRNRSTFCIGNEEYAKAYGNLNLVFPKNNTKFGVSADDDIWSSILNVAYNEFEFDEENISTDSIPEIEQMYITAFNILSFPLGKKSIDLADIKKMDSVLSTFNKLNPSPKNGLLSYLSTTNYVDKKILDLAKNYTTSSGDYLIDEVLDKWKYGILNYFDSVYSAKSLKCYITNTTNISKVTDDQEIWFSGPSIMIPESRFKVLKDIEFELQYNFDSIEEN